MTHWTERAIKARLDRTFTYIDREQRIHVAVVDEDFIPDHKSTGFTDHNVPNTRVAWTPDEDTIILSLRKRDVPYYRIAALLGRTEESVRKHCQLLRAKTTADTLA